MNRRTACLAALFTTISASSVFAQDRTVTVLAAASMKNAFDDINVTFTRSTSIKVMASYAASSTLVRRIERGAPSDVFASADIDWMDYGIRRKVIKDETCTYLFGNELVLIASKDSKLGDVTIGPGFNLAQLAGDGRIATGDVEEVPVGKYAKEALEKLGSWTAAAAKFRMTEDVRAALSLVAQEQARLGIVYATDAKIEPRVKIIGTFAASSHRPIVYPIAATATARPEADAYLSYLHSAPARAVFDWYGFFLLIPPIPC